MNYKDLIYKITSRSDNNLNIEKNKDVNPAKKSVQVNNLNIGVIANDDLELSDDMIYALKREIERTLTVLFNSPISDQFAFLPYNKRLLEYMTPLFPSRDFHYVTTREEFNDIKKLKQEKLNIKSIYPSLNKKEDFLKKIDYLVTLNYEIEETMKSYLDSHKIMIFPMSFRGTESFSQKEKLVTPDPTGWSYNSASGLWTKTWGDDGSQTIQGW